MTLRTLDKKLKSISNKMKLWDDNWHFDKREEGEKVRKIYIDDNQARIFQEVMSVFKELKWKVSLQSLNMNKDVVLKNDSVIDQRGCGTPVRISPCGAEYEGKTYDGILLGDIALSISASISNKKMTVKYSFYNPAIYVPELKKVIFGCESWWSRVKE